MALFLRTRLISSLVTLVFSSKVKSTIEPVVTGTLKALPSNLPFNDGITLPMALAAPVEVGIILAPAALPRLDFAPFL